MDLDTEFWQFVFKHFTILATMGGMLWGLWRFWIHRESASQIEFDVDAVFHGSVENDELIEIVLKFQNKGKTRVKVRNMEIRIRGIKHTAPLKLWDGQGERLYFPDKLIEAKDVVPKTYNFVFMEPGITQEYRYVSKIPSGFRFLLLRGEFRYLTGNPHSAERVITLAG